LPVSDGGSRKFQLDCKRSVSPSFILADHTYDRYLHGCHFDTGGHYRHSRRWRDVYRTSFTDLQLGGACGDFAPLIDDEISLSSKRVPFVRRNPGDIFLRIPVPSVVNGFN